MKYPVHAGRIGMKVDRRMAGIAGQAWTIWESLLGIAPFGF